MDTQTASAAESGEFSMMPVPQLVVAFDGEPLGPPARPTATGASLAALSTPARHILLGVDRVEVGRGRGIAERRVANGRPTLLRSLTDRQVSTQHLVLSQVRGAWYAEDAGSKNGTLLNGQLLGKARIVDGDVLEVGRTTLLFLEKAQVDPRNASDPCARSLRPALPDWASFHDPLVRMFQRLADLAPKGLPILVLGETGTGKEVVARGVHALSELPGTLVSVNCAAVSDTLVEAEFFGHAKGAFTGAGGERQGWIRSADRGTLFLDEIGDLPIAAQAALLRALETGEVVPVGSDRAVKVQFRLISATNRDLDAAVEAGTFRADLRARLGTFSVHLPPLRDRLEDLPLLVARLLARLAPPGLTLGAGAGRMLLRHAWPGNVRELTHALMQAVALAEDGVLTTEGLPLNARPTGTSNRPASSPDDSLHSEQGAELVALLRETRGNVAEVGRRLGKHRELLYRMFEKYGIDPALFRD